MIRREATSIWYEKAKLLLHMDTRASASWLAFADMLQEAKGHGALAMVQDIWVDFLRDMRSQGIRHGPVGLRDMVMWKARFFREPKCRCKGSPCQATEYNSQHTTLQAAFQAELANLEEMVWAAPDYTCITAWGSRYEATWTGLTRSIEGALASLSHCCPSVLQHTSIEWEYPYMMLQGRETRKCLNYLKPAFLASE